MYVKYWNSIKVNDKINNPIPPRVILTSGTSVISLITAHSLGKRGLEIIGAGSVPHTPLSFSKYVSKNEVYKEHTEDPDQFLNDLERIIKDNKPADERVEYIFMPTFKETFLVSKNKARFSKYITVACPDPQCIDKIHPKQNLAKSISKLDVRSPLSFLPQSEKDILEIESHLTYPVLIKPYNGSGGRGIKKVNNRQELLKAIEDYTVIYGDPPLVQEIVAGEDYCLG